jgi:hypothetical protein
MTTSIDFRGIGRAFHGPNELASVHLGALPLWQKPPGGPEPFAMQVAGWNRVSAAGLTVVNVIAIDHASLPGPGLFLALSVRNLTSGNPTTDGLLIEFLDAEGAVAGSIVAPAPLNTNTASRGRCLLVPIAAADLPASFASVRVTHTAAATGQDSSAFLIEANRPLAGIASQRFAMTANQTDGFSVDWTTSLTGPTFGLVLGARRFSWSVSITDAAEANMRLDAGASSLFAGLAPTPAIRVIATGSGSDTGVVAAYFFGEQS